MTVWEIIFTVLGSILILLVILYFIGRRLQKKQEETTAVMEQSKQTVDAFIIDKKKQKMKDANFPAAAIQQVPWYLRNSRFPMAKVRVGSSIGPQIATMICDPSIYEALPVMKTVKITISGAYITAFSTQKKGDRKPEPPKKKTFKEKLSGLFKKKNKTAKTAAKPAKKADKKSK